MVLSMVYKVPGFGTSNKLKVNMLFGYEDVTFKCYGTWWSNHNKWMNEWINDCMVINL